MANIKCVVKKDFGQIGEKEKYKIFLRLIEWNNNPAKYDLRGWTSDNAAGHGIVFSKEELKTLASLIDREFENDDDEEEVVVAPKKRGRKPKAKEEVVEEPKKRGRKPKVVKETAATEEDEDEEESPVKDNVVQFPGEKPKIIELPKSNGKATVLECREKLEKEREIYKDGDSKYVIEKLLELCDRSQDFRNNVMREEKTYAGGFKYMTEQVRNGYCMKIDGGVQYLDNDLAFALFVDYFNMDEDAMEEEKKKNTPAPKKRGRKKGK